MKKIYFGSILISILVGIYLFTLGLEDLKQSTLILVTFIPFFLFTYGLIGLIINFQGRLRQNKKWMIGFPIGIALVFYFMLIFHILILLPQLMP